MRELWLLRHGQTDLNVSGVYFGLTDVPLNESGRMQAQTLSGHLNGPFDLLLTSPLLRARQTAEIVLPGSVFATDQALTERNFGDWEGWTTTQMKERTPADWQGWQEDWQNCPPPGGESFASMWSRSCAFLDTLLARSDWERCLLVSHGGPLRCLLAHGLQLPCESVWRFAPDNARLSCLCFNQEGYGWLTAHNTHTA